MIMKKTISLVFLTVFLTSCQMIIIEPKKQPKKIEINQKTPLGAVYLFKAELDSNDISAAAQILANPNGNNYLPVDEYEMYPDLSRIARLISKRPVTLVKTDTLNSNSLIVKVEFDYLRNISFTTSKIRESWFIVAYQE